MTMYKVVELQPTDNGRLVRVGPVWQPTLERARQMAVEIARQSVAARIYIEDAHGQLVETVRGAASRSPAGEAAPSGSASVDDDFAEASKLWDQG